MAINPYSSTLALPENIFINRVSNAFAKGSVPLRVQLEKSMEALTIDPSNPTTLAQYQAHLTAYTLSKLAETNTAKALKDIDMSIIRNFI